MISSRISLTANDECISRNRKHKNHKSPLFVQLSQGKIIRRKNDYLEESSSSFSDNDADISSSLSEDEHYKLNNSNKKRYLLARSKTFMKSKNNKSINKGSFRRFHLTKNIFSERNNYEVSPIHKYLPFHKKNDEAYKHNLLKYLRHRSFPYSHTQNKLNVYNKKESKKKGEYKFLLSKQHIQNDFVGLIKKYRTVKKIYKDQFCFYRTKIIEGNNINTYPVWFTFYNDIDIGLKHKWQEPLQVAELDDDVETDAEQLFYSEKKIFKDLKGGINDFTNYPNFCRNLVKYNRKK